MAKAENKLRSFIADRLAFFIIMGVSLLCAVFIIFGTKAEDGSITLDGKPAKIEEYTEKFIENANDALYRLMNEDAPTDAETIEANDEPTGQGAVTTLDVVLSRRRPDGDNDGGNGWQCSKYTAYLATGKKDYSKAHPDYGPVNGKDVASWLVRNYGWKYVNKYVSMACSN